MDPGLLYIDVCCLCRPFDDQRYLRIKLETDALYLILEQIIRQKYQLMYSKVHVIEINAIENIVEKNELFTLLKKTGKLIHPKNIKNIQERAEELHSKGLGLADAAHLAFAESGTNFFISCDDAFLKKGNKYPKIPMLNPIEFCI